MYEKELEIAKRAARMAGGYLKDSQGFEIDSEKGRDIKLSVDRESEKIILGILAESGISILSEEMGMVENETELLWIVDPLDGTMNYKMGMGDLTCVSIALFCGNTPLLGVIYRYISDEMFEGIVGEGAKLNGEKVLSSSVNSVSKAILGTGFTVNRSYEENAMYRTIRDITRFKKVRMLGTAATMAVYVGCGKLDAYIEEKVMIWDVAAAVAIVTAAGGICELVLLDNNQCICKLFANKELYDDYTLLSYD